MKKVFALIVFLTAQLAEATPLTVTPGDVLRLSFTTNPQNFGTRTPDLLYFETGNGIITSPITWAQALLFDGNVLLGTYDIVAPDPWIDFSTYTGTFGRTAAWASPNSKQASIRPNIDFTNILNGTIDGRVDITVQTGSWLLNQQSGSIPQAQLYESFDLYSAGGTPSWITSTFTLIPNPNSPNPVPVPAPVPEPSSASLLAIGLGALVGFSRFRHSTLMPSKTAATIYRLPRHLRSGFRRSI